MLKMERVSQISRVKPPRVGKPVKLLLEINLNKEKIKCDVPVNMQLNTTSASLTSSNDTLTMSSETSKAKSKTIEIKIKIDIADANSIIFNGKNLDELQPTTTLNKMISSMSLSTKDVSIINENQERIFTTKTMRKMASRVSLAINDENKEIENNEETVFFDVLADSTNVSNNLNITSLIESEFSSSHDKSFWHKTFEKIRKSYQTSQEDKKVVEIIHELILEKYKQALSILKQKIDKREQKHNNTSSAIYNNLSNDQLETKAFDLKGSNENKNSFEKLTIFEKKYNSTSSIMFHSALANSFNDSKEHSASNDLIQFESEELGLHNPVKSNDDLMYQENNQLLNSDMRLLQSSEEDIVEYDAKKFLIAALGQDTDFSLESQSDYQTCIFGSQSNGTPDPFKTEQSIGSSNLSDLMSYMDRRKSAEIYSLYSSVDKNNKKKIRNTFAKSTKSINDDYGYESLDDLDANYQESSLTKDSVRQNEIINQISKAVGVCRSRPEFFESDLSVETEKILLVASLRKEALDVKLQNVEYDEIDSQLTSSSVILKNLEFCARQNTVLAKNMNFDWYYVCIIHQGSRVYATKTVLQENNIINFPDVFTFEGLPSDFEIHVSIYGMMLKNKKNKKPKKNSRENLKMVPSSFVSKKSYFGLWGQTTLKPCHSSQNIYNLSNVLPEAPITDVLKANLETTFRINIRESGFLTVGVDYNMGHPIWNRRWCSLNGSRIRYWNYPNEEEHCEPLGEIDLLHCISNVQQSEKDVCIRPRTLVIRVKENGQEKKRFLSADNLNDLEKWHHNINLVLNYIQKWSNFQCFLEN